MKTKELSDKYGITNLPVVLKPFRDAEFISNKHFGRRMAEYTEEETKLILYACDYHKIMGASWSESLEVAVLKLYENEPDKYEHFLNVTDSFYFLGQVCGSYEKCVENYVEKRKAESLAKLEKYEAFLKSKKEGKLIEYIADKVCIKYKEIEELMFPEIRLFCHMFTKDVDALFYTRRADLQILNSKSLGEYIRETKENTMKLMKQDFAAMEEICNGVRDYLSIINFTEMEKCIIELRFGFIDNKIHTLQEVGNIKKVSRERVREIEVKALRKLRFKIMSEGIPETYHSIQRIKENRIYDSADDTTDIILRELEKLDAVRINHLSRIHEQTHDN
ncbi:MAG: sigma factor-like helix-turn-helix DNA-binding protein, partial [Candidatus Aenigmatarchaeota archaeon]